MVSNDVPSSDSRGINTVVSSAVAVRWSTITSDNRETSLPVIKVLLHFPMQTTNRSFGLGSAAITTDKNFYYQLLLIDIKNKAMGLLCLVVTYILFCILWNAHFIYWDFMNNGFPEKGREGKA